MLKLEIRGNLEVEKGRVTQIYTDLRCKRFDRGEVVDLWYGCFAIPWATFLQPGTSVGASP